MYTIVLMALLFFMSYSMVYMRSPLPLAIVFMLTICVSVYCFYLLLSDFMSYMLFLIYVGGLLVLLIYMIMVSMNYVASHSTNLIFMVSWGISSLSFCSWFLSHSGLMFKPLLSSGTMPLVSSSLVLFGILLLYIFLNVCTSVVIGGRALELGM